MKFLTKSLFLLIIFLPGLATAISQVMRLDQLGTTTANQQVEATKSLQDVLGDTSFQKSIAVESSENEEKVINARIAALAATLCLASGVSAHYYMSRAGDAYDQYLHAGNPRDMGHYFDRTASLDHKAGYSLVVFEVSLLVALFSFIQTLKQ
ncbi:MAG: hypothetical protein V3U24_02230 [Candidatus Neomarinimicrobiota bacterium]